ncbi:TIGR00730 family Rossman fold protein [Marinobacter fuscus]|uniref:Cytokinin riboside 5'-monophosphate phosphoribohydrolase n=1 Tax=Marinobacter fuscus TaxID=2109942 RepID=A0A2T1KJB6_9GAMM|nr:TIGR00730 family Rossman fold protein [Marinobacter fuscus]PSF09702.1 TIGR00730 family Rossman fold protein [Marinobacter fuscus]
MKIAVFCGSSSGENPVFAQATRALGHYLATNGVDLVYGGGNVGLMGVVADAFLEKGAKVYGVIPEHLKDRELAHHGLTELKIVANMHERKAAMAQMADAFVALPGGVGTLEEIFEAWTWTQLGYYSKPCAFYNINGFYNLLFETISNMATTGFVKPQHADMLIRTDNAEELLTAIRSYEAPRPKWT